MASDVRRTIQFAAKVGPKVARGVLDLLRIKKEAFKVAISNVKKGESGYMYCPLRGLGKPCGTRGCHLCLDLR